MIVNKKNMGLGGREGRGDDKIHGNLTLILEHNVYYATLHFQLCPSHTEHILNIEETKRKCEKKGRSAID